MTKSDLIPLGQIGNEEYDKEVREKLKGTSSPKRVFAQSLRRLKENPSKTGEDIYELISNPNASAVQIQELIKQALEMDLKPYEFIQLINTVIKKHSAIFGSKIQLDANVNVKSIQLEFNLKDMALRLAEHKYIEKLYPEWVKKFSEEQAREMYNYLIYKYKIESHILKEMTKKIREMLCKVSSPDYEKKVDVKFYTEKDYDEFKKNKQN